MRIFLCHSSRDNALVREIRNHLPPWLQTWVDDERLRFGAELAPSLKEAIDSDVDYVLLLLSRAAADSVWVKQEVSWALERETKLGRTFLLPVLLDEIRDRLSDYGLEGRVTLEIGNHKPGSSELLAATLTNHLGAWMAHRLATISARRRRLAATDPLQSLGETVLSIIDDIPGRWRAEVASILVDPFVDDLTASRGGTIRLTAAQYYTRILSDMRDVAAGSLILAVSTLSSDLWIHDLDQTRYVARNYAAVGRGAHIQRLFILPEGRATTYVDAIRLQSEAGISVRVATTSVLARVPDLEDFVMFESSRGTRAYVAQTSIDGSRRIRSGTLVASDHALSRMKKAFDDAWDLAITPDRFFDPGRAEASRLGPRSAPGMRLRASHLDSSVVTCEEAAAARNIPLEQELKTLVLQTHHGFAAAHLPGDAELSLRKVKIRLETAEAYLAGPEDLARLRLSPGTVCAILEPVWSMPHLVSRRLLTLNTVATNNGTQTGYFKFDPAVLTKAVDVIVDDFER